MAFTAEDILGEFVEVARFARYESSATSFVELVEKQHRFDRARWLRNYHRLHARPEWRKARAAKMRAHRAKKKAEKNEVRSH